MIDDLDPDALSALAVFPLPNVVLVPRALVPLHIFEQRYRDMTEAVIAGSGLMAVARLRPGYEDDYEGRPPVFPIAGLGEVVASERMPDGRYHIMLRGLARVDVSHELPAEHSYRRAAATVLDDSKTTHPSLLAAMRQRVTAKCQQLAEAIGEQGEALSVLVGDDAPPGDYADLLGGALITNTDERQRLLEQLDPAERLDQLVTYVSALLTRFGPPGEMLN